MEYFSLVGLIFVIHLVAVMSPGPDFVLVLKNAIQHDRKIAIYTSLGISLGIAIHIIYSLAGVAYLLQKNEWVFISVKIAGALYIIYLGYKTIITPTSHIDWQSGNKADSINNKQAVQTGFITNALNPKASLFFLSIFSLIIPPKTPNYILLIISLMLISVTFLWFALVSIVFTNNSVRAGYEKYEKYLLKFFGLMLILLGVGIFFEL